MRPIPVVVNSPGFNDCLGLRQVFEPVLVQMFIPQPSAKTLDVSVLYRLPRIDKVQFHLVYGVSAKWTIRVFLLIRTDSSQLDPLPPDT